MEVKLIPDGLPQNLLKFVSEDGFSDVLPNISKFLKPGMLFNGIVLKSFPDKNKAIVQLDNRKIVVETRKPMIPGESFSAQVEKTSSQPIIKIVSQGTQQLSQSPRFDADFDISLKRPSDTTSIKTQYKAPLSRLLTSSDIQNLNLTIGQVLKAKVKNQKGTLFFLFIVRGWAPG